jgi:hypothetical protein
MGLQRHRRVMLLAGFLKAAKYREEVVAAEALDDELG